MIESIENAVVITEDTMDDKNSSIIGTEVLKNGNVNSESVSAVEETADIALVDSNDKVATDQVVTNGETETVTPSENQAVNASTHVSGKDVADARNDVIVSALPGKEVANEINEDVKTLPDIVEVYALASFRNSPNASLMQDDIESMGRFVTSKDHLKRNVAKVEYDIISSNGINSNGTYDYTVQVKILVFRRNRWEGVRSYIWKHLGSDIWERGNGTIISLSRIHQK